MKATCRREGLLTALQVAAGVASPRSPRPILRQLKLELAPPDQAVVLATDLEVGVRYRVSGVSCDESASLILPTQQILPILREMTDDAVVLEESDAGLVIAGGTSRFELASEDPLQFPEVPDFGTEQGHRVQAGVLARMIRRTEFAAAGQKTRFALNSVHVDFEDDTKINFVATDSKRLAMMPGAVAIAGEKPEGTWLIPPKALKLLQKVMGDPEEAVELSLRDNEALFRTSKVTVYTRLVEGRYPRYRELLPTDAAYRIPLEVGKLHAVVRQANIVTSEESRGVVFRFGEGTLRLESQAAEVGRSDISLPIGYDGEPVEVMFDATLLIDVLRVLEPDQELMLELVESRKKAVLKTQDEYAYVVMPLTRKPAG